MNVKRKSSWILLFAAMLLTSCSSSTVYDDETFFINFDAGGGRFTDNQFIKTIKVNGKQLSTFSFPIPDLAHRSYYTFIQWADSIYTDDVQPAWNFSNYVLKQEMTLYARWQFQWFDYEITNHQATIIECLPDFLITTIEIPSTIRDVDGKDYPVKTIEKQVFLGFGHLTSITISKSITTIKESAFGRCNGLTSIVIPDSVTKIETGAFEGCDNLTIYCEAPSQPSGWALDWNPSNRPVVWGYKI